MQTAFTTKCRLLADGKIARRLLGFSPARFVQVTVKTEILSSEALGQENDLIGVSRKMFNDVEDGREHGGLEALNGDPFGEAAVWQRADQIQGVIHCGPQLGK